MHVQYDCDWTTTIVKKSLYAFLGTFPSFKAIILTVASPAYFKSLAWPEFPLAKFRPQYDCTEVKGVRYIIYRIYVPNLKCNKIITIVSNISWLWVMDW